MGRSRKVKRLVLLFAVVLASSQSACFAGVVCDKAGWNKYGTWADCLEYHREPGNTGGSRPIDERRGGQVEKIHKNLDGSVTVWRHGSSDYEVWTQVDKDTWERKD